MKESPIKILIFLSSVSKNLIFSIFYQKHTKSSIILAFSDNEITNDEICIFSTSAPKGLKAIDANEGHYVVYLLIISHRSGQQNYS